MLNIAKIGFACCSAIIAVPRDVLAVWTLASYGYWLYSTFTQSQIQCGSEYNNRKGPIVFTVQRAVPECCWASGNPNFSCNGDKPKVVSLGMMTSTSEVKKEWGKICDDSWSASAKRQSAHARHCATKRRAAPWWTRAAVNCVTKAHSSPSVTPIKTFAPCAPTEWKSVKLYNFSAVCAH